MKLPSLFARRADIPPKVPVGDDELLRARTRARRRLVGAIVLVAVGVVVLPLVFDGEPRPLPPDIPIEIPRQEGAPPLVMPPARPSADAAPASSTPATPAAAPASEPGASAPLTDAAAPPARPADPGRGQAIPAERANPEPRPAEAPAPPPTRPVPTDAERARAALEGRPAPASPGPAAPPAAGQRFVVQVGAFADPASARAAVERVEKLGLKPYTQVVQTASGPRTRVRLGPFATREEAQRVQARTEAAGIKSVVLTP